MCGAKPASRSRGNMFNTAMRVLGMGARDGDSRTKPTLMGGCMASSVIAPSQQLHKALATRAGQAQRRRGRQNEKAQPGGAARAGPQAGVGARVAMNVQTVGGIGLDGGPAHLLGSGELPVPMKRSRIRNWV